MVVTDNDGLTPEQRAKIESVMPMDWKAELERANAEIARLREALDLKTVAYDEVSRDVVALREENERLRVAGQAVLDAKGTARRYAAKANLRATLATPKTEGRRDV